MDIPISLNRFFKYKNLTTDINDDLDNKMKEIFGPTYDQILNSYEEWKQNPYIIQKLDQISLKNSKQETFHLGLGIIRDFLSDKINRNLILTLIKLFLNNVEEIAINAPIADNVVSGFFYVFR